MSATAYGLTIKLPILGYPMEGGRRDGRLRGHDKNPGRLKISDYIGQYIIQ